MKIFIKTLKGTSFDVETGPDVTIADLKKIIENIQGADVYPADKQMLIHQGKVLKDDACTVGESGVAENSFLVIMLSKAKPAASGSSSASSAPASQAQTQSMTPPVTAPTSAAPQAQLPTATQAVAVPAATVPSLGEANVYGQAASNLVAGSELECTIQNILEMGGGSWDRDTVLRALRAAFNNPDRAIDYLYTGIPEPVEVPLAARVPAAAAVDGNTATQAAVPSSGPNASPLDLFPQGLPNMGSNAGAGAGAGAGASSLDFLRNSQQFQTLRTLVQANPQILQPMLQELGKQNPHLMRLIQQHQNDFVRLINEPVEGGVEGGVEGSEGNLLSQLASSMPGTVSITPEDRDAIERLEAMGFRRETVLQVYFACNKDEELAANYLLDHMDEFANEDDEAFS